MSDKGNGNGGSVTELRSIARRIHEQQQLKGWSDGEVCRRFAGLGSTKTYKRILNEEDDLSEGMRIDRQLDNYKEAWLLIEMASAVDEIPEPLYDDFGDVVRVRGAIQRAMSERGNKRMVIVEGQPGAGKTAICEMCEERWPNILVRTEATEIWKDSPMAMLKALLLGVGKREQRKRDLEVGAGSSAEVNMPQCADERFGKLKDQLNEQTLIVWIDEAHHLGPRTLNLVKALINQTPTVFVLSPMATLWARLASKAYEEARQLTQNRLSARVQLAPPNAAEALEMLERRGITWTERKVANGCGLKLVAAAAGKGNWGFVVLVARKLRELYKRQQVDEGMFIKALAAVEKER